MTTFSLQKCGYPFSPAFVDWTSLCARVVGVLLSRSVSLPPRETSGVCGSRIFSTCLANRSGVWYVLSRLQGRLHSKVLDDRRCLLLHQQTQLRPPHQAHQLAGGHNRSRGTCPVRQTVAYLRVSSFHWSVQGWLGQSSTGYRVSTDSVADASSRAAVIPFRGGSPL